ncbi:MAG TPA: AI-2E family transporter [Steroidobacteraceae bacterium]
MYSAFYRRSFLIGTIAVLGWILVQLLHPLWATIGWGAVLAFLIYPLHQRLTVKLRGRTALSAAILTVLTPFLLIAPLTLLAIAFARQVANIVAHMKGRTPLAFPAVLDHLEHLPVVGSMAHWMRETAPISADQLRSWITDGAQTALAWLASMSGTLALGVMGSLVGFCMMLFLLFFFLRDGRRMLERLTGFIPMEPQPRAELLTYLGDVTRAVVFGSTATALIQGVFVGVGFAIVGLPSPIVFGVLASIAAFLPAGATFVLVPGILYLVFSGHWGWGIFLTGWGGLMAIVENVLRPILTAHRVHISTLAVFIGAIGGAASFGILGLVIGPVVLGFAIALLRFAAKRTAHAR